MTRCDVCNGTKTVRLPVLQAMAWNPASPPVPGSAPYKNFPCPQCGDVAPIDADRLQAVIDRRSAVRAEQMLLETINEVVMRIDTTSGFSDDEKPIIKQRIYHATDAARARWRKTEGKT